MPAADGSSGEIVSTRFLGAGIRSTAMFRSGARIAGTRTSLARLSMAPLEQQEIVGGGCFAGAPGMALHTASAQPAANGTMQTNVSIMSVSV